MTLEVSYPTPKLSRHLQTLDESFSVDIAVLENDVQQAHAYSLGWNRDVYFAPLVIVTWLPFCLTGLKPNSLQRILVSVLPSMGASLANLKRYRFDGFLSDS
jgi:hypothetical protein